MAPVRGQNRSASQALAMDYIDVATRIVEFRTKHPEGTLSRIDPSGNLVPYEFVTINGTDWVIYTAFAYRTPDDKMPGVGTAWEPIPGRTNFTRDSELQNAETAAWGRAMVAALAVDTKNSVASAEERRNREAERPDAPAQPPAAASALSLLQAKVMSLMPGKTPQEVVAHVRAYNALRDGERPTEEHLQAVVDALTADQTPEAGA